jgi:dsDNA-binding SOS-regulon protein
MKKKKKEPKKRADKYDKKLSIDGSLDDVLNVSVPRNKNSKKD